MKKKPHRCPACDREFKSILDYPRVRILSFERLPIPEAVDTMSAAAAEKWLARRRARRLDADAYRQEGINMTPAIEKACNTREVQDYFAYLEALPGQEVNPRRLLPKLQRDACFRWAYPVADTGIYLSLSEAEKAPENERIAEVQVHCDGPNMGSAGGPTLQPLGAIARLRYEGLFVSERQTPGF